MSRPKRPSRSSQPENREKATVEGGTVGQVFETTVSDVLEAAENTGFTGAVDIGVTFKSITVDRSGFLQVVFGNNDATRIYVEAESTE